MMIAAARSRDMFMERVEEGKPIERDEFERRLARWIESGDVLTTVGDSPSFGGAAWIFAAHQGDLHDLNADSTEDGVREYLRRLASDPQLPWTVGGLDEGFYAEIANDVVRASPSEQRANPRSSSAKLRWARRG